MIAGWDKESNRPNQVFKHKILKQRIRANIIFLIEKGSIKVHKLKDLESNCFVAFGILF